MWKMRNVYTILVGKPVEKRLLGRQKDNIRMDLKGIGWDGVNWIRLAQDRDQWRGLVNVVMNLRLP
jgi:hypothetical protein